MFELYGKYNSAKIFTDICENEAQSQIIELLNQEMASSSSIRIMPDVHAGAGCTIGTTMTLKDKVIPNLVGVDIGCGMEVVELGLDADAVDFDRLDETIRKFIPSGCSIRSTALSKATEGEISKLHCVSAIDIERACKSIGTLGGGNHFIELDTDSKGKVYIVIHSGSRHLGVEIAKYYQNKAIECKNNNSGLKNRRLEIISQLKLEGRQCEIEAKLAELNAMSTPNVPDSLAYCSGELFDKYIHDMKIAQKFAADNRKAMSYVILDKMGWVENSRFTTIHNYIDTDNMILRKGAVSAQLNEKLIIPMNMRDGSLICIGKGNADWNYSAPHGAGRLMSRSKAKEVIELDEFRQSMDGIYTTSVCNGTIDESPMAYKSMESIIENIGDTVDIVDIIKPIYNFKASS